ncbi:class I SAM-dependent methyltransferase [Terrimonas ferruginea]|uniref:class I SAM-dependent methyltransferase n=1 Tax=Terrimonas ferruginea TaxID=249 RepID=UPI000416CFF9|nr:class I SAM-dependent methyltransferase [Terrimonas ferruginea]
MLALLRTGERTSSAYYSNNYVFQRHVFAYQSVIQRRLATGDVLEIGSGSGYGMQMVSPYVRSYTAVDKKKPREEYIESNCRFYYEQLPYLRNIEDESVDTVICFQVIEHIKDDHGLMKEIRRVLRPGGCVVMTTPNKRMSLTRNPFHVREYTPREMQALVQAHFPGADVQGIYGNEKVMAYYGQNKRSVAKITRYDVLNLQHRLPAWMLRMPYSVLNNVNRYQLLQKIKDTTLEIDYTDFYTGELDEGCLDYFVVSSK